MRKWKEGVKKVEKRTKLSLNLNLLVSLGPKINKLVSLAAVNTGRKVLPKGYDHS